MSTYQSGIILSKKEREQVFTDFGLQFIEME